MTLAEILTVITEDTDITIKLGVKQLFNGYKDEIDLEERYMNCTVQYIWFSKFYNTMMIEL